MTLRTSLVPAGAAVAAVALLVAGLVAWRMTFVPVSQSLLVRSSSHVTHVGCPPNTSCVASRGTVILGSDPGIGPGTPRRRHPLLAQLLWTTSALLGLLALDAGLRRRRGSGWGRPVAS